MAAISAVKYTAAVTLIFGLLTPGWAANQRIRSRTQYGVSSEKFCVMDAFRCQNGDCIQKNLMCDGRVDCSDGSDETSDTCGALICSRFLFRCKYGACIDSDLECDNFSDCADGSDEDPLLCRRSEPERTTFGPLIRSPSRTQSRTPAPSPRPTNSKQLPCLVPPQPTHGRWKLHKSLCDGIGDRHCDIPQGVKLDPGSQLIYRCIPGYTVKGYSDVWCKQDGSWSASPECIEAKCGGLNSASTMAICTNESGDKINCNPQVPRGTRAEVTCRSGYRKDENYIQTQRETVHCNPNGEWDPDPITCIPGPLTVYVEIESGVIRVRAKGAENSTGINLVDVTNNKVIVYTGQRGNSEIEPNLDVQLNVPHTKKTIPRKTDDNTWGWS